MPIRNDQGREWLIEAKKYVICGLTPNVAAASTEILTPGRSAASTVDTLVQPKFHILSESEHEDVPPPPLSPRPSLVQLKRT